MTNQTHVVPSAAAETAQLNQKTSRNLSIAAGVISGTLTVGNVAVTAVNHSIAKTDLLTGGVSQAIRVLQDVGWAGAVGTAAIAICAGFKNHQLHRSPVPVVTQGARPSQVGH